MFQKPWQENLRSDLQRLKKPERPVRVAVLGIGHELYGDDAVGMRVAGHLSRLAEGQANLLAVQGGSAPENFTGTLRCFAPDLVLMVDAALMGLEAGGTGWLNWREADGFSASTHTLPLHILASYLTAELGCEVALLGIQPAQTEVGARLSPAVRRTAENVAKSIGELLGISGKSK
jgi:hydrogenase 3 maturation protease